ncbi:MAG: hypothetical protein ACJ8NS_04770 [Chthoniobacterales bacterium]
MKPRLVFKLLIVSTVLFPILTAVIGALPFTTLPIPLSEFLRSQPTGSAAMFAGFPRSLILLLGIAVVIVVLAAFVGLWRFRRWGRALYVAVTVVYAVCMPLMGPLVLPASLTPLFYVGYLIQGAVIAMAYLPPVADVFATKRSNQAMQRTAPRSDA